MKIRTVQMLEKGKGDFMETDIPDGSWIARFRSLNTAVPADQMKPMLPLPKELMQVSGTGEGRKQIHSYIEKEWIATVSNDHITPQWHVLGYIKPCNSGDEDYPDYHGRGHWEYILVADKPFGVICWQNCHYYHDDYGLDWEDFVVAGRVTGDKITRGVVVRRPRFIKSESEDFNKNGWRWTQLSELAQVLGEDPMTVWEFYFHIGVGSSHVIIGRTEHTVFIGRGDKPGHPDETDDDEGMFIEKVPPPLWPCEYHPPYDFQVGGGTGSPFNPKWLERMAELKRKTDPMKVWVPAGWAMTACYLHHFGFKPAKT